MQHYVLNILSKIPRYLCDSLLIIYWKIRSLCFKDKNKFKKAWVICERGIEARDNGFAFFKYVRQNYPNQKVFYLIDPKQENDYQNVAHLGNIIIYKSPEHYIALFFADCILSTHIGFITPWSYVCHKTFFSWLKCPKFVLLNHGITKEDMSAKLNKFVTGIDLFIAANQHDYNTLTQDKRYGYTPNEVALTGYARYDRWQIGQEKKQIVFMPTWRAYLVHKTIQHRNQPQLVDNFIQSVYYQKIQSLLNNKRLDKLLADNKMQLIFYPHYEMQSAMPLWSTNSNYIKFADKQHYDIPTLMRESKILITDYSGVGFDFAYMYKPVVYYQFDQNTYYQEHYQRSETYSLEQDGLGQIVYTESMLVSEIQNIIDNQCIMPSKYQNRVDSFFTFHDTSNCERIYNAVRTTLTK